MPNEGKRSRPSTDTAPVPALPIKLWRWRHVALRAMNYLNLFQIFSMAGQCLNHLAEERLMNKVLTKPRESGATLLK